MVDEGIPNEKSELSNDDSVFQIIGFRKLSSTFIFLIIISLITSYFGLLILIAFPAIIFILFPKLYQKIGVERLNKYLLKKLSSKRLEFLDFIPGISIKGKWFIEKDSEIVEFKSKKKIFSFIFSNWTDFFLIPLGLVILIFRFILLINPSFFSTRELSFGELVFEGNLFFLIILVLPVFYAFYYPIVWSWYDAELKIANWRKSSKGGSREVTQLFYAANSLRNALSIFAGFNAIAWIYSFEATVSPNNNYALGAIIGILIVMVGFISGIGIFQGIMYYRSGIHEQFVNNLRSYVLKYHLENHNDEDIDINDGISVYQTKVIPFRD